MPKSLDFTQATKRQLYVIATDLENKQQYRDAAVKELLRRRYHIKLAANEQLHKDEIIFAITLASRYSEDYLQSLDYDDLIELYERVMNQAY